jgi:hypothetical protein
VRSYEGDKAEVFMSEFVTFRACDFFRTVILSGDGDSRSESRSESKDPQDYGLSKLSQGVLS